MIEAIALSLDCDRSYAINLVQQPQNTNTSLLNQVIARLAQSAKIDLTLELKSQVSYAKSLCNWRC